MDEYTTLIIKGKREEVRKNPLQEVCEQYNKERLVEQNFTVQSSGYPPAINITYLREISSQKPFVTIWLEKAGRPSTYSMLASEFEEVLKEFLKKEPA